MPRRLALAACAALLSGGCGTLVNHTPLWQYDDAMRDRVYGGVRHDVMALRETTRPVVDGHELGSPRRPITHAVWSASLVLLDLPLSLVADTLWLPWDLQTQYRRRSASPPEATPPPADLPAGTT